MDKLFRQIENNLELNVHLVTGSTKSDIVGINNIENNLSLRVAVHSKPTQNKANSELIKILSEILHIAKSRILIKQGLKSHNKKIIIVNYDIKYISNDFYSKISNYITDNIIVK